MAKVTAADIEQAIGHLIHLIHAAEAAEGQPVGHLDCEVDVTNQRGETELWRIRIGRAATLHWEECDE